MLINQSEPWISESRVINTSFYTCTKRRNCIKEIVCSYSLHGCWWPNCHWSQCILSEPVPQWLNPLSSAPCTLWDRGQHKGCSSTCGTKQSHMYTKPHDKQKSLIHTCCEQNMESKKRRYDGVFLLSLKQIWTITDCLCQGRGSCCAKCQHWEQGCGVTLQGRPRVQSRMNETFSQTCQRHRLITDCFCRYVGHDWGTVCLLCRMLFFATVSCETMLCMFVQQL